MNRILLTEADSNPVISGVLAVMVHVFFLGALALSINWQKRGLLPAVNVELWRELPRAVEAAPSPRTMPAPARTTPTPVPPDTPPLQRSATVPALPQTAPAPPERVETKTNVAARPPIAMPTASRVSPALDAGAARSPVIRSAGPVAAPAEPARLAVAPKSPATPVVPEHNPTAALPEHTQPKPLRSAAAPINRSGEIAIAPKRAALPEPGAPAQVTAAARPSPSAEIARSSRAAVAPEAASAPKPPSAPNTGQVAVAEPKLVPEQRRVLPQATVAPNRSGPAPGGAVEPAADVVARVREQEGARKMQEAMKQAERRREDAMQLAEQLRAEEEAPSQEQVARESAARRDDAQQRRQERSREIARAVGEQAAAIDQGKAEQPTDTQARAATQSLIESYMARIGDKIRSRVVLPLDLAGNPEAIYEVQLIPGGEVTLTRLRRSSGQPNYDASVERAILAAQPLPVPDDLELFRSHFARFNLSFRPIE